jgi:predicted transcriptional regulator of viral defense system
MHTDKGICIHLYTEEMPMNSLSLPDELKERPWFTYDDAKNSGLPERHIYQLRDEGAIQRLARGIYQATDYLEADPSLLTAAALRKETTLCLASALAHHDLTDEIPTKYDLALPRGTRSPNIDGPIRWHFFDAQTFDIGRTEIEIGSKSSIGIYSPERCIIDAFRLRGREGYETANGALKRWLRRSSAQPSTLLTLAQLFPRASGPIQQALEILL